MAKKLDKTLADYVVGGVMPALLIGLLVSLCYFLLELALSGQHVGQLKWVLFFFIVGTVLIARIAMRGDIADRAGVYGIALAIAAGLALVRFVEIPQTALGGFGWLVPISLMSVIWWSAHRLTLDSTFDDDDTEVEDAGGFLDAAPAEAARPRAKNDWFGQYQADREAEQQKKKPGIMLVYFSLAALPLFGIGQAILPAADVERRRYAFWLLTLYVACGLGMLLTTSFLGLRRYLRGRRLQMPAAMTGMWLGLGSALIVTLMVLSAYFLPRPEAEYHLSQLLGWASSKKRDANKVHFFEGSSGESNDNSSGGQGQQPDARQPQGDRRGERGGQRSQNGSSSGQKQSGEQKGRPTDSNNQGQGNQSNQGNQGQGAQGNQGQGQRGSQGQGNNGQGNSKSQSGSGSKTGSQGQTGGGNQKTGEKQPGQRGEQDQRGQGGGKTPDKDGERGNQDRGSGQGDNQKDNEKQQSPDKGQQPNEEKQGGRGEQNQEPEKQQQDPGSGTAPPPPPPQQPPPQASTMSWDWLRWLIWAIILVGVLFALWKWGRQLWNALLQIWREIMAWWAGLFGMKEKDAASHAEEAAVEANRPPQPFAWFSNPLLSPGRFKTMEEMIRYSFAALHSWAYEQNLGRHPDETPTEFAQRLGRQRQRVHQDVRKLADLYAVVTYARVNPPAASEAILRNFWNRLAEEPPRPVVVN